MKRILISTVLVLVLAGALFVLLGPASRSSEQIGEVIVAEVAGEQDVMMGIRRSSTDREEVFKRAFWRRPVPGDRIVNAELAEWTKEREGKEAVSRWQWFIQVSPSAELLSWLEKNPFGLIKGEVAALPVGSAPSWFPVSSAELEIHQSSDGEMSILIDRLRGVVFATASGHGFAAGKPRVRVPSPPVVKIESRGRLPLTPPPSPRSQR